MELELLLHLFLLDSFQVNLLKLFKLMLKIQKMLSKMLNLIDLKVKLLRFSFIIYFRFYFKNK